MKMVAEQDNRQGGLDPAGQVDFDLNTGRMRVKLKEWETIGPERAQLLQGLRLGTDRVASRLAAELARFGCLECLDLAQGLKIHAYQYVGSVILGKVQVIIQPKLEGAPLLNLMRYAFHLRNLDLYTPVELGSHELSFQDLLICQLAAEFQELFQRGLYRCYEQRQDELASPRGRIAFDELACGGPAKAALPCRHFLRLEDNLLNRVLLAGLRLSSGLTHDLGLRSHLRSLARQIESSVGRLVLNSAILEKARAATNRQTSAYRSALTLIELLYASQGVSLQYEENPIRLPGFLFDMNRFFQALISRFLHENLASCELKDEFGLRGMLTYEAGHNPNKRTSPTPRPDFAILREGRLAALLDAKYRDLWVHDLPREMLYQLALYAFAQGSSAILYPTLAPEAREAWIEIQHPFTRAHLGRVVLRPVNLLKLDELISTRSAWENARQRRQLANWMAFGE